MIGEDSAIGRIGSRPIRRPLRAAPLTAWNVKKRIFDGEHMRVLLKRFSRYNLKRRVVIENIKPAPKRSERQVVLAPLHIDVAHGNCGQTADLQPLVAAIE